MMMKVLRHTREGKLAAASVILNVFEFRLLSINKQLRVHWLAYDVIERDDNFWQNKIITHSRGAKCMILTLVGYSWKNIAVNGIIQRYMELTATESFEPLKLNNSQFHCASPNLEGIMYDRVASLEEEILEMDTFLGVLSTEYANLRSMCEPLEEELQKLQERSKSVQKHLRSVEHECINRSKELDVARAKFVDCIACMSTILQDSHIGEHTHLQLLSHVPIQDLMTKYDKCHQYINFITSRNHLEQQISCIEEESQNMTLQQMSVFSGDRYASNPFISHEKKNIIKQKSIYWKKAIIKAKNQSVLEFLDKQENLDALKDISQLTKDIQAGIFQPSQNKLRIQLLNFQDKLEDLNQVAHGRDIFIAINQLANAYVMQITHTLSEKAKRHQNHSFDNRHKLLQCIEAQASHCHLFFLLLLDEKLKFEDITQLSQEYSVPLNEELKQLSIRREKMKMIRVDHDVRGGKELCADYSLPKMLLSLAQTKTSYQQLFDVFKKLDYSIPVEETELLDTSFQVMEETINNNLQSLQELEKILFAGTTKKPVVMDLDLSCQLYDIGVLVKRLQEKLMKTVAECEVTQVATFKKAVRNRRLLWVHFLTDYKQIDKLIAGMEQDLLNL